MDPKCRAFVERRAPIDVASLQDPCVTVTYKDTIDVAGFATRLGNSAGYRHYPIASARIASLLTTRRFLCLGKVANTEFNVGTRVPCVNPRFPELSPGGSSTGSGVAVAAGLCDMSIGTDSAGSARWPAANCGVVGMRLSQRPAFGQGVLPVSPAFDSLGLITRTVEDLSYIWERETLSSILLGLVDRARDPKRAIQFGVVDNYQDTECDPEIRCGFESLVARLQDAGVVVRRKTIGWWRLRNVVWPLLIRDAWDFHAAFRQSVALEYEPGTWSTLLLGRTVDDDAYLALTGARQNALMLADEEFSLAGIDVLLLPFHLRLPRLTSEPDSPTTVPRFDLKGSEVTYAEDPGFTLLAPLAACPALSLPIGASRSGAPISAQLIARRDDDEALLTAGEFIERLVGPWHATCPGGPL